MSIRIGIRSTYAVLAILAPATIGTANVLKSEARIASTAVRVIDGDTIDINGDINGTVRIRISNIDTPELHGAHCERERTLGIKAKERLQVILDSGKVTFTPTGTDRYRRVLAHVFVDGNDIGEQLIREGHAIRWVPGPVAKAARIAVWCDR